MKENKNYYQRFFYFAMSIAFVWGVLVWGIIDYKAMLVVMVTIGLMALIAFVAIYMRKGHNREQDNHDNDEVKQLQYQVKSLTKELRDAQIYCTTLESKISNTEQEFTLDQKYRETLVFIQRIDNAFRNLDANIASPNFADNISKSIDIVFSSYGYRFTDYSEQTKDMYDCEYQPIEAPNIVFRTVTRKDGCIAVKGKVFLPKKF